MKKSILFASALVLSMAFTSCNKDEDTSAPLEGKWNFNKFSITNGSITTPEQDYDENEPGCNKNYFQFVAGGVAHEGSYTGSACTLDVLDGTWVKNGNTLTVTEDGDSEVFEIKSLTNSELKVSETITEGSSTYTLNLTFIKA